MSQKKRTSKRPPPGWVMWDPEELTKYTPKELAAEGWVVFDPEELAKYTPEELAAMGWVVSETPEEVEEIIKKGTKKTRSLLIPSDNSTNRGYLGKGILIPERYKVNAIARRMELDYMRDKDAIAVLRDGKEDLKFILFDETHDGQEYMVFNLMLVSFTKTGHIKRVVGAAFIHIYLKFTPKFTSKTRKPLKRFAEVSTININKKYRGRGYGGLMLWLWTRFFDDMRLPAYLLAFSRSKSSRRKKRMSLTDLVAFYKKLGFEPLSENATTIAMHMLRMPKGMPKVTKETAKPRAVASLSLRRAIDLAARSDM